MIFDDRICELGEGPLWHPERGQLFWFDILGKRLLTRNAAGPREWGFPGHVSAAGWVDRDRMVIASETGLALFDLATGASEPIAGIEADDPATRSNDGRADPWGGFWIGTMAKAEPRAGRGAIWRYYRGELRRLHAPILIPNATCFAPDGSAAYFADSMRGTIWRQKLREADGWPAAEPEVFLDLRAEGLIPDGAVVDREGNLWNAQWGAGRVAVYGPDGRLRETLAFPARQVTCPAFGGAGLSALHVTSATEGLPPEVLAAEPDGGRTFVVETGAAGQAEHRVIL